MTQLSLAGGSRRILATAALIAALLATMAPLVVTAPAMDRATAARPTA